MAEHVYDEIQEIELDSAGYIKPLKRSNQTPNAQRRKSIVKKTNGKRCIFVWIGIIIGSVFSGILVFSVFKYGRIIAYDGSFYRVDRMDWMYFFAYIRNRKKARSYAVYAHNCQQNELFETRKCNGNISDCFWTEWTSWTGCNAQCFSGTEKRVQIYTGYAHNRRKRLKGKLLSEIYLNVSGQNGPHGPDVIHYYFPDRRKEYKSILDMLKTANRRKRLKGKIVSETYLIISGQNGYHGPDVTHYFFQERKKEYKSIPDMPITANIRKRLKGELVAVLNIIISFVNFKTEMTFNVPPFQILF